MWKLVYCKTGLFYYRNACIVINLWHFESRRGIHERALELSCAIICTCKPLVSQYSIRIIVYLAAAVSLCKQISRFMKSQWIMQVCLRTSHTEKKKKALSLSHPWLCAPLGEYIGCALPGKPIQMQWKRFHIIMFSHNSGFYLAPALVKFVCKQRGEKRGRDGTNFMDFEALRTGDTSVKIYLSTRKSKEGSQRGGDVRLCRGIYVCTAIQSRSEGAAGRLRGELIFLWRIRLGKKPTKQLSMRIYNTLYYSASRACGLLEWNRCEAFALLGYSSTYWEICLLILKLWQVAS